MGSVSFISSMIDARSPCAARKLSGIDGPEDERAFTGEGRIDSGCSWPLVRVRMPPGPNCLLIEPHCEAARIDQGAVILVPIANAVADDQWSSCHGPILATAGKGGNVQQRRGDTQSFPQRCHSLSPRRAAL